jgi:hypothetical protein
MLEKAAATGTLAALLYSAIHRFGLEVETRRRGRMSRLRLE